MAELTKKSFKYFENIYFIKHILERLNVPCEERIVYNGAQLRFPWCDGDVACHEGTYGSSAGKVETYQFPWDDGDVTMLTPEEAIAKIANYYFEKTLDN